MHPASCVDLKHGDMKDRLYPFSTFLQLGMPSFQGSTHLVAL